MSCSHSSDAWLGLLAAAAFPFCTALKSRGKWFEKCKIRAAGSSLFVVEGAGGQSPTLERILSCPFQAGLSWHTLGTAPHARCLPSRVGWGPGPRAPPGSLPAAQGTLGGSGTGSTAGAPRKPPECPCWVWSATAPASLQHHSPSLRSPCLTAKLFLLPTPPKCLWGKGEEKQQPPEQTELLFWAQS